MASGPLPVSDTSPLERRVRWLLLLALAGAVLFTLLYVVAVHSAWGQEAGNAALAGAEHRPSDAIYRSGELLDTVSVIGLAVVGGALCLVGLARAGLRLAMAAGLVILGANVATQLLKTWLLERPAIEGVGNDYGWGNSFPSGHATVAMSLVVAAALVLPARSRVIGVVPLGLYAIAIGLATVTAGWHRPSDVVGAMLLVTTLGAIAALALLRWGRTGDGTNLWNPALAASRAAAWRGAGRVSLVIVAVALVLLLGAVVGGSWDDLDDGRLTTAYLAGCAFIAASGVLVTSALLGALSGIDLGAIDDRAAAQEVR